MSSWSIAAAATALRAHRVRASELTRECCEQIDRFDSRIQAWAWLDHATAEQQARRFDGCWPADANQGESCGPLAGIPLGIKDIIDVAGMPTRAGSGLTPDQPARQDAAVVARLRAAGAVILGKTVTTEFACFDPSPTRNPWNLARTPGGSSSGSAAAVALGMCFGAVGTQTGGSIIRPAAYCGVCGFKPSFDAIDRQGIIPVSEHLDHVGPLARTVGDLQLLWTAMSGQDDVRTETRRIDRRGGPQLGILDSFCRSTDCDMQSAIARAVKTLAAAGATCRSLTLANEWDEVWTHHRTIMAYEVARFHLQHYGAPRSGYGSHLAGLIAEGLAVPRSRYLAALEHQAKLKESLSEQFEGLDAWLLPATPSTAPGRETTGDPRFNSPWSYAGVPAATIPCGLAADGLPAGLQLVGMPGADRSLLETAHWCEQAIGFVGIPPMVAD